MINWFTVLSNGLWVMGLALAFAALGFAQWQRIQRLPTVSLREALGDPAFQAVIALGLTLVCVGLALSSSAWWQRLAWATVGLLLGWQTLAFRRSSRDGSTQQSRAGAEPGPAAEAPPAQQEF